jgi:hypothetical protein
MTALTSTSITLAWDPHLGPVPIASYEVWGWINNGVTSAIYGTGITNTTLTITGLVPGSMHEWGVRAHDASGYPSGFDYGPTVVNPMATPALLSCVPSSASGGFQLIVQAGAVQTMLVQATTTPADSNSWVQIGSLLPSANTFTFTFTFTDTNAAQYPMRFYRVVAP